MRWEELMVLTCTSLAVLCLWVRHDPLLATLLVHTVLLSIRLTILSASCIRPQKTAWLALRLVLGGLGLFLWDWAGSCLSLRSFHSGRGIFTLLHDSCPSKSKHFERLAAVYSNYIHCLNNTENLHTCYNSLATGSRR
jgi:hypothetical protein